MKNIQNQELKATNNYELFEMHTFNREVRATSALERSMLTYGFIGAYPLHVVKNGNGKLKIVSGHHRYTVARKLGIPVKYVVCEESGPAIVELENATRSWSLEDYLKSYCQLGKTAYLVVKGYHEYTSIPLQLCIKLCAGLTTASGSQQFKAGTYRIGDMTHANNVAFVTGELRKIGVDFASSTRFASSISKVLRVKEFNVKHFLQRAKKNVRLFTKTTNDNDCLAMIETVYNHASKMPRLPLAFLATEEMRKRQGFNKKQ